MMAGLVLNRLRLKGLKREICIQLIYSLTTTKNEMVKIPEYVFMENEVKIL